MLSRGLLTYYRQLAGVSLALLLAACGGGGGSGDTQSPAPGQDAQPFQELIDQGVTRYLGMYSPMSSTRDRDVSNYQFGTGDGPLCLYGTPYTMATRDEGTEDLMIFLLGGGFCRFDFCWAWPLASPGIPPRGILDPKSAINPLAGMSTVYVPYCDGGIFASDADVDLNNDGLVDRYQRGLRNLSAALDVAVRVFPAPRRIVLVGVSAGSYATLVALPLVRYLYPDIPIDVVMDSGIGITRPNDPQFNQQVIDYWNAGRFVPASCPECKVQGSPAGAINWLLRQDPNTRVGILSFAQDDIIGTAFLGMEGPDYEAVLRSAVLEVETAHPTRMHSFIHAGTDHSFLLHDLSSTVQNVSVHEWVDAMIHGPAERWKSVSE